MQFVVAGLLGLLIIAVLRITRRRRHRAIFGRRDGMEQTVTAFIVAPLMTSAAVFILSFAVYRQIQTALLFSSITAGFGYFAAVALGIHLYRRLRWQNVSSPDITWAAGALIASQPDLRSWQTSPTKILRRFSE